MDTIESVNHALQRKSDIGIRLLFFGELHDRPGGTGHHIALICL